jgi:ATP-dependent Clp protease ATP-binding subunit ClpA
LPERGAQESLFDYLRRLLERLRELQPASSLEQQMLQEQRQYLIQLIERLSAGNAVLALTPAEVAQQLHEWTGIPVEQIMAD